MPNEELTKTKVILVEGKDEINFFTALFKHLNKNDVDIVSVEGKEKLKDEFAAFIKRPSFTKVTSYAIIVDADHSCQNTFKSVSDLLKKHSQPVPTKENEYVSKNNKRAGIYIMPGNLEDGMLEDFCLQTVSDHPAMPCLNQYFDCLKKVLKEKPVNEDKNPKKFYFPKNLSKAKALVFLGALYDSFYSIGIAALRGYWNFDHASVEKLKSFLQEL